MLDLCGNLSSIQITLEEYVELLRVLVVRSRQASYLSRAPAHVVSVMDARTPACALKLLELLQFHTNIDF